MIGPRQTISFGQPDDDKVKLDTIYLMQATNLENEFTTQLQVEVSFVPPCHRCDLGARNLGQGM
jgi:hypothetical protein